MGERSLARFLDELCSEFEERVLRPLAILTDYHAPQSRDHPYWVWRRKATGRYARRMFRVLRGDASSDMTSDERLYSLIQDCLNVFERESLRPLGVLGDDFDLSHPYWEARHRFITAALERLHRLESGDPAERKVPRPVDQEA
ncbi:MAG TPA: hypothetical protein VFJ58_29540 [Armatimonadota bacterium]|nr:hypothetical protein [Armatimonadota bacterium]